MILVKDAILSIPQAVYPVFDGHNDTITKLREIDGSFFAESDELHITMPLAKRSGLIGGFFAVWVPDTDEVPDPTQPDSNDSLTQMYASVDTLPPMMTTARAAEYALISLGRLRKLEREGPDELRIVRTTADIERAMADGAFSVEIHFEGAEPIDPKLDSLDAFYAAGLR